MANRDAASCQRRWTLRDKQTHHLVVSVLGRQVQRDVSVQGRAVDRSSGPEQQQHRLGLSLPGGVMQRSHACGGGDTEVGGCVRVGRGQGSESGTGDRDEPLLSLMSTVAWASSSADSSSVVPVRAAWWRAENLGRGTHTRLHGYG